MFHHAQLLFLIAAFLVPNSKAVISNNLAADMNNAGYHCSHNNNVRSINLIYGEGAQGLPCKVTFQKTTSQVIELLEAKRNTIACESKAASMATRLVDRGWQCQSSGI